MSKLPESSTSPASPEIAAAQTQQRSQPEFDDAKAPVMYTNVCRVMGTPEELIIDFGLILSQTVTPGQTIAVNQRVITSYYAAKRMLYALDQTIRSHEHFFGVLETDVQKRVRPGFAQQYADAAALGRSCETSQW